MSRTLAIILLTLLLPAVAAAQETVTLSDNQRSYNEQGVSAIRAEDYSLAISSFESSLALGEANIIRLNLGRAYQRAGDCMNAKLQYGKVASAPAVAAPSREEILGVLQRYAAELPEVCPATVKVVCDDPLTMVALDGGEPAKCGAALELETAPGPRTVVATLSDKRVETEVAPKEGEAVEVAIAFPADEPEPEPVPAETEPAEPDPGLVVQAPRKADPLRTIGLITGAVGAATLTTGLILDVTYVRDRVILCIDDPETRDCTEQYDIDRARNAQRANRVVFAVGGGLTIAGVILYLAGGSPESGVSVQFNDGPGIVWSTRF